MNETVLPLLEQAITILSTMEVCFLKYVFLKPKRLGRIGAWIASGLLIYVEAYLMKHGLGLSIRAHFIVMIMIETFSSWFFYEVKGKKLILWMLFYMQKFSPWKQ